MADVKTVRLRNAVTGVVVEVRAGKALGSEWVSADVKPAAVKSEKSSKSGK